MRPSRQSLRPPLNSASTGSVLLEVVLALAIFVGAATVITSGIHAAIQSTERLRLQTHAMNLAVSVMSEMQMHARPVAPIGPEPFPSPFQEWNCKIEISQPANAALDADALTPVEVIIRHATENTVARITMMFPASALSGAQTNEVPGALQSPAPFSSTTSP